MVCTHCKRELAEHSNFCYYCGASQQVAPTGVPPALVRRLQDRGRVWRNRRIHGRRPDCGAPRLGSHHVFHWHSTGHRRLPGCLVGDAGDAASRSAAGERQCPAGVRV
jgi:hypothetical protein